MTNFTAGRYRPFLGAILDCSELLVLYWIIAVWEFQELKGGFMKGP